MKPSVSLPLLVLATSGTASPAPKASAHRIQPHAYQSPTPSTTTLRTVYSNLDPNVYNIIRDPPMRRDVTATGSVVRSSKKHKPKPKPEPEPDSDPETDPKTEPDTDPETDTETNTGKEKPSGGKEKKSECKHPKGKLWAFTESDCSAKVDKKHKGRKIPESGKCITFDYPFHGLKIKTQHDKSKSCFSHCTVEIFDSKNCHGESKSASSSGLDQCISALVDTPGGQPVSGKSAKVVCDGGGSGSGNGGKTTQKSNPTMTSGHHKLTKTSGQPEPTETGDTTDDPTTGSDDGEDDDNEEEDDDAHPSTTRLPPLPWQHL